MSKVFLSHSSKDKEFVRKLATDLISFDIPVWFDEIELSVGDSLNKLIEQGLKESSWFAIVLSKNAINSSWVEKEITAGLSLELERKSVFILPILLDDCDIPLFLKERIYADFRIDYDTGLHILLRRLKPQVTKEENYTLPKHILDYYPKFPLVEPHDVPKILIDAFTENIDPLEAKLWISETNAFRKAASSSDENVGVIPLHRLPVIESNPYSFWIQVFENARRQGPKVLAALLITTPDDNFSQKAKDAKNRLLEKLKNYS